MIALLVQEVSPPDNTSALGPHSETNIHGLAIGRQIRGDISNGVDRDLAGREAFVLQGH